MHYYVSLFSSLAFWWVNWLLSLGFKKHLELSDLGVVPQRHEAKFNHERFRKAFLEETVGLPSGRPTDQDSFIDFMC